MILSQFLSIPLPVGGKGASQSARNVGTRGVDGRPQAESIKGMAISDLQLIGRSIP